MSRVFGWLAFALVLMLGPVSAQVVNPPYTPVNELPASAVKVGVFGGTGTSTFPGAVALAGAITGATTINASGLITGVGVAAGGPITGATSINGLIHTFASCTDSSIGVTSCSATVAYTSTTSYACGMSYVASTTTTGSATGEAIVNTSNTSVTGTIVGLSVATGTATLLFECLGS